MKLKRENLNARQNLNIHKLVLIYHSSLDKLKKKTMQLSQVKEGDLHATTVVDFITIKSNVLSLSRRNLVRITFDFCHLSTTSLLSVIYIA